MLSARPARTCCNMDRAPAGGELQAGLDGFRQNIQNVPDSRIGFADSPRSGGRRAVRRGPPPAADCDSRDAATTGQMAWPSAGSGVRRSHGRRDLRLVRAPPQRPPENRPFRRSVRCLRPGAVHLIPSVVPLSRSPLKAPSILPPNPAHRIPFCFRPCSLGSRHGHHPWHPGHPIDYNETGEVKAVACPAATAGVSA
jgi:hypothetical protein